LPSPTRRVDASVCDPRVRALLVGTGEALSVHPLGCSPAAFHLTPGAYRCWGRSHTRRGGAGETTDGAIARGAWLEKTLDRGAHDPYFCVGRLKMGPIKVPKARQAEDEEEHEQEQEHLKGHNNPRCLK